MAGAVPGHGPGAERHRARLARALEAELRALKLLRELARPEPQDLGSLVQPILVEVRVLGRRGPGGAP